MMQSDNLSSSCFVRFPSIEPFNKCLAILKKKVPILPEEGLVFVGTTKLHGTNAAIGYNYDRGLWAQSRERVITIQNDNLKFAEFVHGNSEYFIRILKQAAKVLNVDLSQESIVIFGEYCGQKIQKNVAVSELPRMFVAFDVASSKDGVVSWHDIIPFADVINDKLCPEVPFYNIGQFQTFSLTIKSYDLDELKMARTILEKTTENVEKLCPVGFFFGITPDSGKCTTGEGVVWRVRLGKDVYRFKVKGDQHAISANQRGATLSVSHNVSFQEFIKVVVSDNRCQQGISEVFGDAPCSKEWEKRIGEFQHWIVKDVKKEEMDSFPFLDDYNGINGEERQKEVTKNLNRALSKASLDWFHTYLISNTDL